MIDFRINIRMKDMLGITPSKKCCNIKSVNYIAEFIRLCIKRRVEKESVTKRERDIYDVLIVLK